MTFWRRHRFWKRLVVSLAFAAATASPAAAMQTVDEPGAPAPKVSTPSGGNETWNDVALALGSAALLTGVAGAATVAHRSRKGPRLARA
jgi:hypothetical protein